MRDEIYELLTMQEEAALIGNLKSGEGSLLFLAALTFAAASFPICQATKFASAAPSERTASAQNTSIHYSSNFKLWRSNGVSVSGWNCNYDFIAADGTSHTGSAVCPQWIIDTVKKGGLDSAHIPVEIPVYYDPDHPSINSLLELNTASRSRYQDAVPDIGIGALLILLFMMVRKLAANERTGKGGVIVDNKGTVIHPEEIGLDSEEFNSRTKREAGDSTPSLELREFYLELVKKIHPDRAANEPDRVLRERLMTAANAAFERADSAKLREILEEYKSQIAGQPGLFGG